MYRQAKYDEPLIFELGKKGRRAHLPPKTDVPTREITIPDNMKRKEAPGLPELHEGEVVRHYLHLSQMNYSVDTGIYPLGSCTMKYNPKINEALARSEKLCYIHPYQPEETVQGILEMLYRLQESLTELAGLPYCTLQPAAGAQGEYVGLNLIRAYHHDHGDFGRTEIVTPDSSHGTNPASTVMNGFKVIEIESNEDGQVDLDALRAVVSEKTAGFMITNPNTLGIFESQIVEIAKIIHEAGGLLYYDGANFNAIVGKIRPGEMGFDVLHFNLHKTFSTPHGGGGPGAGAVCCSERLAPYLPVPTIEYDKEK
ncbi:MAG: aminomethyl-transferring glycine dehydrogenase subunit GcvPB, partial [Candidatus Heimdallarchaeaceae archaeon]